MGMILKNNTILILPLAVPMSVVPLSTAAAATFLVVSTVVLIVLATVSTINKIKCGFIVLFTI